MNSVISAFKTKKNSNAKNTSNEKQHNGSGTSSLLMHTNSNNCNKKKAVNAQDNGYQYLRHIREIETATKLLSPVVVVDDLLESDKLNFRASPPACVDVVDHAPVRLTPTIDASKSITIPNAAQVCLAMATTPHTADLNMNGAAKCVAAAMSPIKTINKINVIENGNCSSGEYHNCNIDMQMPTTIATERMQPLINEFGNSPTQQLLGDVDDDESENSTTACISSSSEHSNSTVVHSPTSTIIQVPQMPEVSTATPRPQSPIPIQQQNYTLCQQQPSPAKSLTLSLSSNTSSSCSCSSSSSTLSSTTKLSSISTASLASASASVTSSSSSLPSSFAQCASVQSNISNAISNGCDTTIAASTTSLSSSPSSSVTPSPLISPTPKSPALQPSTATTTQHNNNQLSDYVPAFLKSPPITLPIIMPNGNSNLVSVPPQHHTTTPINSAANTPKHARFSKPRLGLSRFINHSMPSVHGRPNLSVPGSNNIIAGNMTAGTAGPNTPKRMSTHQRNLSLDFRSMGILLPPVSQVTNTRINLTQHHRNRSLDSALQRIPEVEVSSPNAESDNTFCTPSILGSTMCSKIVTTAASVTAALTTPALTAATTSTKPEATGTASATISAAGFTTDAHEASILPCKLSNQTTKRAPTLTTNQNLIKQPRLSTPSQHQINSSLIVEPCSTLRSRPKSTDKKIVEVATTSSSEVISTVNAVNIIDKCQIDSNININAITKSNNNGLAAVANGVVNSKKREDLTSLGSDDSGIICGSESDQISLNRIRHSHESLDSGEMDAEEECIDMLETTSMDEEYNLLQSDLCFYQSPETDCRTLRPTRKKHQKGQSNDDPANSTDNGSTIDISKTTSEDLTERIRYRDMNMSQAAIKMERSQVCVTPTLPSSSALDLSTITTTGVPSADLSTTASTNAATTPTLASSIITTPQPTNGKAQNDVLFKNFFGATKNAIFRTAQSIIENHEKKNAAKSQKSEDQSITTDQIKSPTDISKKKEFFGLITSHSSKKASAAAAAASASQGSTLIDGMASDLKSSVSDKFIVDTTEKQYNVLLPLANTSSSGSCNASISSCSNVNNTTSNISKSASISSLNKLKVPGVVKCFIKERSNAGDSTQQKTEKGPSGLLRFFESPVFNIHFAVHYLFYSKEPGVLSFIGNKIFSFPDQEVDLYIPQLIVMYIQMDELAEVLDPYLTIRCRKSVDFSLKCLWLLEAYNYQVDSLGNNNTVRKTNLALMKELFSKKERKILGKYDEKDTQLATAATLGIGISPMIKKTHHRSQSDATVLLADSRASSALSISNRSYQQPPYTTQTLPTTPAKLCLGDLTSGRAFDNGCTCFETVRGQVNGLLGQKTVCSCGAPKTAPQKEFMKALINVGKNLTSLPSKAEKTSALRMFLNLINKNLPARVWLPLYSDIPHHVVRITEEKTAVLNSKDKTPYIIYVEVVEVPDIYSSPLIQKMMPSLRHTKSEEHLEGVCIEQMHHISCSRTSSCSSRGTSAGGNGSSCRRKKEKLLSESSSVASEQHAIAGGGDASSPHTTCHSIGLALAGLHLTEDDVWSQEDDEITAQYLNLRKISERDALSQLSLDSCDSRDQGIPVLFNIGDVRTRHCNNLSCENTKSFSNDPEDPSAAALKEPWHEKEKQIRESSPYGHLTTWRLLSAIVKCGDDLRQELMATQLLQMFKIIWQEENVDLWVRPYKIVCLSNDSGLIEPILNTVSLHQIKKNSNKSLRDYFIDEYGPPDGASFRTAQKNFVQSCSAYCLISYLLQVKDRHNGNILLHSDGHIIHIDFGFILSISPKNLGFEQSPFKLTHEFVDVMGGTQSEHWREFNRLLLIGMMSARKHMDRIINFVEIMRSNAQLPCFKNGCSGTVQNLRKRFHMNLTEQEMERKVEQLVQDSLKSLSTKLYDGYQYYTNGIL